MLVAIEATDVVFAVDSIPAIFAVTTDPFIVYTSNIFAILGLRAMYFLLAGVIDKFHYLKYGLALVLLFVGVKMVIAEWYKVPIGLSLGVIAGVLTFSVLASVIWPPREDRQIPTRRIGRPTTMKSRRDRAAAASLDPRAAGPRRCARLVHGDLQRRAVRDARPRRPTSRRTTTRTRVGGVVRGLHYQLHEPQGKLVRCNRGRIFDVAVDIRRTPALPKWAAVELTDENRRMLWVPPRFAHGFAVLSDEAEVIYKCTTLWHPATRPSIVWNDPALGHRLAPRLTPSSPPKTRPAAPPPRPRSSRLDTPPPTVYDARLFGEWSLTSEG